jgi:hypothetical protein
LERAPAFIRAPEPIIHGMTESLLTTQVFFRRLHGYMTQQELDLLQLAS